MPRKPKLIAAAAVIATGLLVAWPLRRSEELRPQVAPAIKSPPVTSSEVASGVDLAANTRPPLAATTVGLSGLTLDAPLGAGGGLPQAVTVAKPVYDQPASAPELRGLPPGAEEATQLDEVDEVESGEQIHIVHTGDSLERLAKRYLGDEGRAIELFDHNRQVLENPHLLPIGAELRIPAMPTPAVAAP